MERLVSIISVVFAIMGKRALKGSFFLGFLLVFSCASLAFGVTTRIMPLGDSITRGWYGSSSRWGYRKPLYDMLLSGGYDFDFVGGAVDGNFPDPQHEGHDGWHADQILSYLPGWLNAQQPDVIMLHIGTNDVTYGDQDVNEVNSILNVIDAFEASSGRDVTVVLALIINRRIDSPAAKRTQTTQFNSDVSAMAMNRIAGGDDIIVVDMESALNYDIGVDMADEVHPNDNGYGKMANVWYGALTECVSRLPVVISGYVLEPDGVTPVEGALIQSDGNDVNTVTDVNGYYEFIVDCGWSGVVTPQKEGYVFEPNSVVFTDVNQDYSDMDYTASLMTFRIAGFIFEQDGDTPISDVNVSAENSGGPWTTKYGGGTSRTDADGYYEVWVDCNWSGKVRPDKYAYVFEPNVSNYENVNQDYTEGQDYIGNELELRIFGFVRNECNAPVAGILVEPDNGGSYAVTDLDGFYEVRVDEGWSGTVSPVRIKCTFEPNLLNYTNLQADQPDQNYIIYNVYDLDCDGRVGENDFAIMTANWLVTGPDIPGDFINDEIVDFLDFADFGDVWQKKEMSR